MNELKTAQAQVHAGEIVDVQWGELICDEAPDRNYPVPFARLWPLLGYTRKDNAMRALKHRLVRGEDFSSFVREIPHSRAGRPSANIWLTMDGAKHLCLQSGTPEGRQIRTCFIGMEKRARKGGGVVRTGEGPGSDASMYERLYWYDPLLAQTLAPSLWTVTDMLDVVYQQNEGHRDYLKGVLQRLDALEDVCERQTLHIQALEQSRQQLQRELNHLRNVLRQV